MELRRRRGLLKEIQVEDEHRPPVWSPIPLEAVNENRAMYGLAPLDISPQVAVIQSEATEILYGGGAGGGKSDVILGLARTAHLNSLILRRTFTDLEGSSILRSFEFYGDRRRYNSQSHVWDVDGRRIRFGHMQHIGDATRLGDEERYASHAYDCIAFDQLEQFSEWAYLFMLSRNRSAVKGQRCRIISSANPCGVGVMWIMRRWAAWLDETHPNRAVPGEVRYYKSDRDGKEVETTRDDPDAVGRTYIPARLADNPHLGDDYRRKLNLLPEPTRSALLNGDWNSTLTDDAYQVFPRAWIKAAMARWTPKPPTPTPSRVGVDVAHGGGDATTFCPRHDWWFGRVEVHPGVSTPDGQSVVGLLHPYAGCLINMDAEGVGASAFDIAKGRGFKITGVNFGARDSEARDESGLYSFKNTRSEMYWRLREALDPKAKVPVALPPDPELEGELLAHHWKPDLEGIGLEPKKDIKSRLGRSPDKADAVVLANFNPAARSWWQTDGAFAVATEPAPPAVAKVGGT